MRLFDTHSHLDDPQFDATRADVVARASATGLERIICVGVSADSSKRCVELAATYPTVFAAVGIQPNHVAEAVAGDWEQIVEIAKSGRVVGLGETGLDRFWDRSPFALQQDYFARHLQLSQETQLPFIVHMRECDEDVLSILREARRVGPLQGVLHSFTGQLATAQECLELGLYVSFAGMVTYPKSESLRQIAATIPLNRILIETDAPYLSPHPKRGQRPNEPSLILHTAECLAKVMNLPVNEFATASTENAYRLFARCPAQSVTRQAT